ncbi:MAG: M48 family metallopeptidase [Sulfurimonas sp.]|nr:M48 family metallopeptidase [Sulfurimonas sp.]
MTLKTSKVSAKYIQNLLLKKEIWIRKQLLKVKRNPPILINMGEEVLLFGEVCNIDVSKAKELRTHLQKIKMSTDKNIQKCYDKFYKLYAKKYLTPRVEYFSNMMNLEYNELKFRKMKSRWGSCNSKNSITLNTELIKVDKELIDFVIVHELAHLTHMNHSKKFHSLLSSYMPNAKELNKKLKFTHLLI